MTIPPFVRQLLVAGSPQLAAFAVGGAVTYPSVLLQQFKSNDSSIHLDLDTASWIATLSERQYAYRSGCSTTSLTREVIRRVLQACEGRRQVALLCCDLSKAFDVADHGVLSSKQQHYGIKGSIHGLTGLPSILMPTIMQWKGRKISFMAACLISIIGWLIAYTASTSTAILISESFHGLGTHCLLAVSFLSLSEMIAPNFRNISMISFHLVQAFGTALVGVIAKYVHWKTISLIMCTFMVLSFLIALTWPESPSWLAYKGEFDKCEKAFIWLRGTDENSRKELQEQISAQREHLSMTKTKINTLNYYLAVITSRDFYLPSLYMFILMNLMYWSGTLVVLIYSTDIIKKATGNEDKATLGGIIINIVMFLGAIITTILLRFYRNKQVLLCSTVGITIALLFTCVVTFLQSTGVLPRDSLLAFYSVIAFMVTNSLGVITLSFAISAELMPVKHRGIGGGLYVVFICVLHSSSLKAAPYLFIYINLWGTFLVYAINAAICGLLIWKYVPETKGKTLQEIEDYYNGFVRRDTSSNVEGAILDDTTNKM